MPLSRWFAVVLLLAPGLASAETCHYSGATDDGVRLGVTATVTQDRALITTDVLLTVTASSWFYDVQYLHEELATFRAGEVQSVAVNARTIVNGRPRRQQWDVFVRGLAGLVAQRVQGKSSDDIRAHHARFLPYWDVAAFGRAWLPAYPAAAPERRSDLDLPAANLPATLRTPLALAFYWSRWLPPGGQALPVFLPGFKRGARAEVLVVPATVSTTGRVWQVLLSHPALSSRYQSTVAIHVSSGGEIGLMKFEIHTDAGSATGMVRRDRCEGPPAFAG